MMPSKKRLAENYWHIVIDMAVKRSYVREIVLPSEISAAYENGVLTLKKGSVQCSRKVTLPPENFKVDGQKIILTAKKLTQTNKKRLNSVDAHIANMMLGVTRGHRYVLKVCSGHFPMTVAVKDGRFTLKNFLGEKVPRTLTIAQEVTVKIEGDKITVESPSLELAGQVSANIEQLTRRPGFDTRVFMDGIYIINKDGKELH